MTGKQQIELHNKLTADFREELQITIKHKLDEINHYVSGCDSPFTYQQIGMVQEYLNNIADELGIKAEIIKA